VVRHQVPERVLLGNDSLPAWAWRLSEVDLVNTKKSPGPRQGDSAIRGQLPAPKRRRRDRMKKHRFTLVLSGVADLTPELADALYEATGGDIECNMRDAVVFLEFDRAARTLHEAITSAIRDVESAKDGIRVVRVESEAANVIAKINATLLGAAGRE
jgi:hypothetical protein